jgi:hypothetical protein
MKSPESKEAASVILMTKAAQMLMEANTIQKARELKDLALTAMEWARRKGLGEEAILYARSYALEAERRMGEMLRETERAKGGQPYHHISTPTEGEEVEPKLSDLGLTWKESSRAQFLAALPRDRFDDLKEGRITLAQVQRDWTTQRFLPGGDKPHVSQATGENEWYTPPEIIEVARQVMGEIDCDPASSEKANEIVRAKQFFSIEDDGLKQKWIGNIWMNPPYAQPLV